MISLETLAVKAFGNMGQTARLRLIRDRFIAGHESCDLRRYLDCVPPDTPLRDIVDRCRVWESHGSPEARRIGKPLPEPVYPTYVVEQPDYETEPVCVVTVNKPNSPVDKSEELLKKLLEVLTPAVPPPVRAPDVSPLEKLVQLLLSETAKREPTPPLTSLNGCHGDHVKTVKIDIVGFPGFRNITTKVLHRAEITNTGAQVRTNPTQLV